MTALQLPGTTAVATGASRGFGRRIAIALAQAGANVVGVARDRTRLEELRTLRGSPLTPEQVGKAVIDLAAGSGHDHDSYLLTAAGLTPVP